MPLNEIIYDFFDALKANTKGYASLDYEVEGYRPSELVKDMLLNGEQVDALSFIAHKEKAYKRARRICEKLKDNIPRQLFEVPVQAAIGGKVIARETVRAMRKDVLAKCYGGDITRRKSCWKSRKRARRRCALWGRCSGPRRRLWLCSSWTRNKKIGSRPDGRLRLSIKYISSIYAARASNRVSAVRRRRKRVKSCFPAACTSENTLPRPQVCERKRVRAAACIPSTNACIFSEACRSF